MKRGIIIFFGIFAVSLLASCGSPDKVRMVALEDFTMVGEKDFEVTIRIANDNGNNLAIKKASLALVEGDMPLISLTLSRKVVIPRRSDSGLMFPIAMSMSDPGVLSSLPERAKAGRPLWVAGRVTGQSGIFSKTYKVGPMPVDDFLDMLDEQNREMIKGFIY